MFLKDNHIDYKWLWFLGIVMILIGISSNVEKMNIWIFGVTVILVVFLLEWLEKRAQEKMKEIEERNIFTPIKFTLDETQKRIKINPHNWSPWIIPPPGEHFISLSFPSWAKIMYFNGIEEDFKKNVVIHTDSAHRIFRLRGEGEVVATIEKEETHE